MNRIEFMEQLELLLSDIPADEKEEALEFYNNYFEDAGLENEEQILKELGSPEKVARTIKSDLLANGEYSKNGEYTENGYKDANENKESIIKVEPSVQEENTTEGDTPNMNGKAVNLSKDQNQENTTQGSYNQDQYQNANQGGYNQGQYQNANQGGYNQGQYQNNNQGGYGPAENQCNDKPAKTNIPVLILLCIFAIPCIIPLFIAGFFTLFGLLIGFGAAAVACTGAGIAVTIFGIIKVVTFPALGILGIGGGLICLGLGILFFFLASAIGKLFPFIFKAIGAIFRAPFGERRVVA